MLEQLFFQLRKLFGKNDRLTWAESAALIMSCVLAFIFHAAFLTIVFIYDLTSLVRKMVDDYGFALLVLDLAMVLLMHTFLIKKFRSYAKKEMDKR